jgi:hypothetical protein
MIYSKLNNMKSVYVACIAAAFSFLMSNAIIAQNGPNETTNANLQKKIVRGCEYEVLPGLAEVVSIVKTRDASESALQYDEHEVLFKFTPMEGGELLTMLKDSEIEFYLRSRAIKIPVGPEYIKAKQLRKGTKYAMNLLQTRNRDACLERYTYESKALDNDLFEAYDNIIDYTKESYVRQLEMEEVAHEKRKAQQADASANETVDPTMETETTVADESTAIIESDALDFDYGGLSEEEIANLSEAEMRVLVEENLRKNLKNNSSSFDAEELGIDEAKIRAEIEAKKRAEHAEELKKTPVDNTTPSEEANKSAKNSSEAIKEAKRKAKEAERKAKEDKKRKEQLEVEKKQKEEELRQRIEREIEAEIQKEIEAKKEADRQEKEKAEQKAADVTKKKEQALEKMKAIELEMKKRIIDEAKRSDCVYGNRISGTIEVVKVTKFKEAALSHLKHVEYQVLVTFRPDNFGDLSKKDKKSWEANYTFTIDPTGKNANPGAGYIRKYKVFKASRYQGFAQPLESGICSQMMIYSPDLPNDEGKIKLK